MDRAELIKKISSGEVSVERIGSARVAPDADRDGVATALETADLAVQFARLAKHAWRCGDSEGAIYAYCQSIVFEESINNVSGICSDLGNVADIFRLTKAYSQAEEILVWLRRMDTALLTEPLEATGMRRVALSEPQLRECCLLHGIHTEGLARVYIATGRKPSAMELMDEMIDSYTKGGSKDALARGLELRRWLEAI